MEIGRIPSVASNPSAPVNNGTSVQATQTILPESQTVTRAARSEGARLNFREVSVQAPIPQEESGQGETQTSDFQEERLREVRREFEVDRDTSALIFRAIDIESGDILRQFPEESRLRLSAYFDNILEE